eukprot:5047104-Pleurochrysis_carterae.AAC.2
MGGGLRYGRAWWEGHALGGKEWLNESGSSVEGQSTTRSACLPACAKERFRVRRGERGIQTEEKMGRGDAKERG